MNATPSEKTVVPLSDKRNDDTDADQNTVTNQNPTDLSQRMASVQELLFGDAQREISERLNHIDDLHDEHIESTAEQFKQMNDMLDKKIEALRQEIRAIDRAQTAKRRKLVGDLGDAIKAMAYDA